jgi:hypothetical protein|tara:strand:+ start:6737 stop:7084 length:348 start_codon:yes stop_codon:yes gene_type:complete
MSLEVKGNLVKVLEMQSGISKAGKEWVKQSFVVDTGAKYNPLICFNLFGQEKVDMLLEFSAGDNVQVLFNLSSREYNGNYYTSADVWQMQKEENEKANNAFDDKFNGTTPADMPF